VEKETYVTELKMNKRQKPNLTSTDETVHPPIDIRDIVRSKYILSEFSFTGAPETPDDFLNNVSKQSGKMY
jgi:hypothetical protein